MSNSKPQQSPLTRQQQKALDKELPWRVIVEKGGDYLAEFIKAAQDEEKSWMRFGSVEPIDQKTADQIMSTAKGRKRVLRSRAAYRDKAKGWPLRAKARVVALGCLDLTSTPWPARVQLHCGSQRCWSMPFSFLGRNRKMNRDGAVWYLWCGDVKTAFLQGEPDPRDEPLYLAPLRDQISILAKVFTSPLVPRQGTSMV